MRRNIPAIIICLLVLGGCNRPQPIVGRLHSVTQSETQNEIVTKRYRATCFPIGDGIWVSTCHRNEERITLGIAQGATEIEVAGERFPVIGARFSKRADYCLLLIEDKGHIGFTISPKAPRWGYFKIILSEGDNRTLSAVPCPWLKTEAPTQSDDKASHPAVQTDTVFPLKASEPIVPGYSGSPVLNNGKIVGIAIAGDTRDPYYTYVLPCWLVFAELNEMVIELKHDSRERGCQ